MLMLKEIIKLRKQDKDERDERDTLLDMYMRCDGNSRPGTGRQGRLTRSKSRLRQTPNR
jgi:hypothetical protein